MNSDTASPPPSASRKSLLGCVRNLALPLLLTTSLSVAAEKGPAVPLNAPRSRLQAPPPAVTVTRGEPMPGASAARLQSSSPIQYSIGEPTDAEQFLVELMNRARANPPAEGERLRAATDPDIVGAYNYFQVDLGLMVSQFATITNAPPLSISAALTVAARGHSLDMLTNAFQGHTSADGSNPGQRLDQAGYDWQTFGENVFAYVESLEHAHAGFEVDWGDGGVGGMQDPPGHRRSIHNAAFREVGVGLVVGSHNPVGPMLVTEDFGTVRTTATAFITGVVYYDLNTNGFYDPGEGIGGVKVSAAGAGAFAITARSGGYSVPVSRDGVYPVTFSMPGLPDLQQAAAVSSLANVKVDLVPAYRPPAISGPDHAFVGLPTTYQMSTVGGAERYELRRSLLVDTNIFANAENDLAGLIADISSGYSVIVTNVVAEGKKAYHLAHTEFAVQSLTLEDLVEVHQESLLAFRSRLGWATTKQEARAEISTDFGATWRTLWSQAGTDGAGDTNFLYTSISLTNYAGTQAKFRFVYDPGAPGSSYYSQADKGVGLYLDGIAVANVQEVVDTTIIDLGTTNNFVFNPSSPGSHTLAIRPTVSDHAFAWGPTFHVEVTQPQNPTAVVRLGRLQLLDGGTFALSFQITTGVANLLILQAAAGPGGPWEVDSYAVIESQGSGLYRVTSTRPGGSQRYYRVQAR